MNTYRITYLDDCLCDCVRHFRAENGGEARRLFSLQFPKYLVLDIEAI